MKKAIGIILLLSLSWQFLYSQNSELSSTFFLVPIEKLENLKKSLRSYTDLVLLQKKRQSRDWEQIEKLLKEREKLSEEILETTKKFQKQARDLEKKSIKSLRRAKLLSTLGWTAAGLSASALLGVLIWSMIK